MGTLRELCAVPPSAGRLSGEDALLTSSLQPTPALPTLAGTRY